MNNVTLKLDLRYKNIAVISDIHSNVVALNFAINALKELKADCVVMLGDVLTYGCHPQEVVNSLKNLAEEMPVYFIKGNHEEFYFNKKEEVSAPSYKVPDFVNDSIVWTSESFAGDLQSTFDWYESISSGAVFLSHANPYPYGNWEYLNTEVECTTAAESLKSNQHKIGIFGHTHRRKAVFIKNKTLSESDDSCFNFNKNDNSILILNSGSIGQPRGTGSSFLMFKFTDDEFEYSLIEIKPDLEEHINKIKKSDMPESSKNKIISFYEES